MGYVNGYKVWIPLRFYDFQLHERDPFLNNLIIGEKTWIIKMCIENIFDLKTIEQQLSRFHPKKVLLSMWSDWKDVLYYELLSQSEKSILQNIVIISLITSKQKNN